MPAAFSAIKAKWPWLRRFGHSLLIGVLLLFKTSLGCWTYPMMCTMARCWGLSKTFPQKRKKNPAHTFRLKYKSRADISMAMPVYRKHWKDGERWFHSFLGSKLRGYQKLPAGLDDAKLVKTRFNKFYLCVPVERPIRLHSEPIDRSIALDPGVRTFLTGYDPSGRVLEIGKDDYQRLFHMCRQVDKIMAKVSLAKNHKQRYQRKRAAARARDKIKNRIKDLHCKAAKHLCESYHHIFLPKF